MDRMFAALLSEVVAELQECRAPIAQVIDALTPVLLALVAALQIGSAAERGRRRRAERLNGAHDHPQEGV